MNIAKDDDSGSEIQYIQGNLVRLEDAYRAVKDAEVIYHCAAEKSGPLASMFLNTVVATRNLMEAAVNSPSLKRFVLVSSFSVYATAELKHNAVIDEKTPIERNLKKRDDGYAYVKIKQEFIVKQYQKKFGIPVVIVRPGVIYGPGSDEISKRVGLRLFGIFLNIGRNNLLPLSYVDNCADAIIKAGTVSEIEGEIINIHDNELCSCNQFLDGFKMKAKRLLTIKVPYPLFWLFSWGVESYARLSKGQIPPVLNRYKTASTWKKRRFSNDKLVRLLSWSPIVTTEEGLSRHFEYYRRLYTNFKK